MGRLLLLLLLLPLPGAIAALGGCETSSDGPRLADIKVPRGDGGEAERDDSAAAAKPLDEGTPPDVTVLPRKGALEEKGSYPCSECHDESLPNDPRERELTEAHEEIKLVHGDGRLWCTTCHDDDRGQLKSLKGAPIDFDVSFLLCGQCHFRQEREVMAGGHGKRVEGWDGPKTIAACTGCHDPHDPSIKPRLPWRSGPKTAVTKGADHHVE